MSNYKIFILKSAKKDRDKIANVPILKKNVEELLQLISKDPFAYPPSYEALQGDLKGAYSRRINKQHRLVYKVDEENKEVIIIRMWTHYE